MSDSNASASIDFPPFDGFSNDLLHELKVRARLRLNALHAGDAAVLAYAQHIVRRRRWSLPSEWKLQHALNIVANELDFRDWQHARLVLSGKAKMGEDMGGFWYSPRGMLLLNHWFARYDDAKRFQRQAERWLFPYGKQFVVGDRNYLREMSLDPQSLLWKQVDRDLVECYGDPLWQQLCAMRLSATRGLPPPLPGKF